MQQGIDILTLFPPFADRADYKAKTGHQAPPFLRTLPVKHWEDPGAKASPPGSAYPFFYINRLGPPLRLSETITAAEAARVNLPGAYVYEQRVVAPTVATKAGQTLDPKHLATEAEARALATEVADAFSVHVVASNIRVLDLDRFPITYGSETRRYWVMDIGTPGAAGSITTVGDMLALKNASGVGHPGHWTWSEVDGLGWIVDTADTTADDSLGVRQTAVRELRGDETLVMSNDGPISTVKVQTGADIVPAGPPGTGFGDADRAAIHRIEAMLKAITS